MFYGVDLVEKPATPFTWVRSATKKDRRWMTLTFLFKGPNPIPGEDVIEISCHGSSYILQGSLDLVCARCPASDPGEFEGLSERTHGSHASRVRCRSDRFQQCLLTCGRHAADARGHF
ncbi:MAG: hypothetical protein R2806_19855 [Saprospiraceae bacterium]